MCASFHLDPEAPRSVTSLCSIIHWRAPHRAFGHITGYDVMFINGAAGNSTVTKRRDEIFHIVDEATISHSEDVLVQVKV